MSTQAAVATSRPSDDRPRPTGPPEPLREGAQPTVRVALRVLVLAPVGRDAELIASTLASAGLETDALSNPHELLERVAEEVASPGTPRLGAVIATDDALGVDWSAQLASGLDRQPTWSDLPIVILAHAPPPGDGRWVGSALAGAVSDRLMHRGSVTVLDRPVRVATLVSAVRAALRARERQIEVASLIEAHARAQQEAERAARVKSDFLAVMSHELRTPLNAIAGYVDLLAAGLYGPLSAEQQNVLERVTRAQRHLLGVINDVLNFARIEKGRVEYHIEPVSVAEIMSEVAPLVEPQVAARNVVYTARFPRPDVRVLADREKLAQVLLNLLSNAVKFTSAGGRITLDVARRSDGDDPPDQVYLRVSDTGAGIAADKLEAIFEPFVQIRAEPGVKREGTGLGLAISRDLARGMGGDLRARSQAGQGSTFTIVLRRAT